MMLFFCVSLFVWPAHRIFHGTKNKTLIYFVFVYFFAALLHRYAHKLVSQSSITKANVVRRNKNTQANEKWAKKNKINVNLSLWNHRVFYIFINCVYFIIIHFSSSSRSLYFGAKYDVAAWNSYKSCSNLYFD